MNKQNSAHLTTQVQINLNHLVRIILTFNFFKASLYGSKQSIVYSLSKYIISFIHLLKQMQPKENKKSETKKPQITFTYNNNPAGNSNAGQSYVMKSNQNVSTPVYQNPTFQYQQLPNFNSYNAPNSYNNVAYNNLQQQIYQQPNYNSLYQQQPSQQINLLSVKQQDKDKKVVAVIVSFISGFSYDSLFTTVQQKSQEGTKVIVYSCQANSLQLILKQIKGQNSNNQKAKELIRYTKQVDPDCVVFNWQCSQGYSVQKFLEGSQILFQFVKLVIDKGHMVMFSDFSLKSLINQWNSQLLGPNPFKKTGETSSPFELHFNNKDLAQCPSAQLQIVGEMAEKGKCHIQAMGGTIVYTVDKNIKQNSFYKMQVLTIAETDCGVAGLQNKYILQINGKKGTAGHILLTYKSGGHLLTSMGHWIQLMKIDTSEQKLFQIAEKQYGASYAQQMKQQYYQMSGEQQKQYVSYNAVQFVQNSAPCSNMASKSYNIKKN